MNHHFPNFSSFWHSCRKPVALVAAFLLGSPSFAATSSVVGFYNISLPAGNSAWVCGLVTATKFQGASATVTADTDGKALVNFSGTNWTVGEFALHYAEPQSGVCQGLALDILSNTATTLKLNTTPAAAGLVDGIVLTVRKHATLAGLLPTSGGLAPFSDSISLFGSNGLQTNYFYNSITKKWITSGGVDSTNVIVRPGQGFVIQSAAARTLVMGTGEVCHVKPSTTKVRVNSGVPNLVGPINPLGLNTTLGALGITGSLAVFNDSIVTLNAGTLAQTGTYLRNGSNLITGGGVVSNNVALPTGASVVVNANAAKNVTLSPVTIAP